MALKDIASRTRSLPESLIACCSRFFVVGRNPAFRLYDQQFIVGIWLVTCKAEPDHVGAVGRHIAVFAILKSTLTWAPIPQDKFDEIRHEDFTEVARACTRARSSYRVREFDVCQKVGVR